MQLPEPDFISSSDNVEVAAYDFGGDGPLLVLCHATGFCAGVWAPLISTLSSTYRCVAIDFRAHGRTALPEGVELVWSGMAEDLLAVVDAFSDGRPVRAVGHSMGGAAIVLAAQRRPDLFVSAWAFEPILFGTGTVDRGEDAPGIAKGALRRRRSFASRAEVVERLGSKLPLSLLHPDALKAYVDYGFADQPDGTVELCCTPENEAAVFEHHAAGAFEAAGTISFPFATAASGDGQPPAARIYFAAATYPHLTLIEYPDLTHFGPLQDPIRVAEDILEWFE